MRNVMHSSRRRSHRFTAFLVAVATACGLGLVVAPPASAAEGSIRLETESGIAYGQHLESWRMSLPVDAVVRCPEGESAYIVHGHPVPMGAPVSDRFTCKGGAQRVTFYPAAYEDVLDLTAILALSDTGEELARDARVIRVTDHQIHWGTLNKVNAVPQGTRVELTGKLEHLSHDSHQPLETTVNVYFEGERVGTVTSAPNGTFRYPTRITKTGTWHLGWSRGFHSYATNSVTIAVRKPDPPAVQLPGPPGFSVGERTTSTAAMRWTAPARPGTERITGYRFGWTSSNGKPVPTWQGDWTAPPNPLVMINLHPGTTYTMWVQALTAKGPGERATVKVTTPRVVTAPSAPRRFTIKAQSPTKARLWWAAPATDGGRAIDKYQVRLKSPAAAWTFSAGTRSTLMTKMKPNTRYTFSVRAHNNKAGWGPWTAPVTVRTPKAKTP